MYNTHGRNAGFLADDPCWESQITHSIKVHCQKNWATVKWQNWNS